MKKVSCIMPTRGRSHFALHAVASFARQTYPNRELIILDDLEDPSFGGMNMLSTNGADFTYAAHSSRSISEKRNICVKISAGEIICHFDSDDWSLETRIADQVKELETSGKQVAAYHSMLFYEVISNRAYWYNGYPLCPIGTSLMYTREWGLSHPFEPGKERANVGEDTQFGKQARDADELITTDARTLMVARIHPGNTSVKHLGPTQVEYRPIPLLHIPKAFFE